MTLTPAMHRAMRVAHLNGVVWATSCVYRRRYYPVRVATLRALARRGLLVLCWHLDEVRGVLP